jgi:NADH-quinone oxidoreductase subunit L
VPIVVLSVLSILGGFVNIPASLGNVPAFMNLLRSALPEAPGARVTTMTEGLSEEIAAIIFAIGLALAYLLVVRWRTLTEKLAMTAIGRTIRRFWFSDWGTDWLYDRVFVRPFIWVAHADRNDFLDGFYQGVAHASELGWRTLRATETGRVRWYAAWITAGTVIFVAIVLWK